MERGVRSEWEVPRRGNKSIAQWQATLGAAPWVKGIPCELRPEGQKSDLTSRRFTFAPSGRHAGMYVTQGVALCYVVLPLQGVCPPRKVVILSPFIVYKCKDTTRKGRGEN